MPKFAANISMLFPERELLDRIDAAATVGFRAVECQSPYKVPAAEFAARLRACRVSCVLINTPPGEGDADRGFAAIRGRETDFMASLERALDYAAAIGCTRIHTLAGRVAPDRASEALFVANLQRGADRAAELGITLLLEPLNGQDNPGYFLGTTGAAIALLDRIGRPNVKLQFDFYHCQITEGGLAAHVERLLPSIGHVQFAGVPGRHEPDRGEINYPFLFDLLDRLGYAGWVAAEYRPAAGTLEGLGWARPWGIGAVP
ncbi:MAG TPA: TIM barrel protein [Stellaceae bacterium]|nr:TIM barrel protein [Stellaceae bacterium]